MELLDYQKYFRVIGDFGVNASLQTVFWASIVKDIMSANADVFCSDSNFGKTIFVNGPDVDVMNEHLWKLRNNRCGWYMILFSDDSCIATPDGGLYNLDISSCDSSHTEAIFSAVLEAFHAPEHLKEIIYHQMSAYIKVVTPHIDEVDCRQRGRNTFVLAPTELYMASGIGITTLVNCYANKLIGREIIRSGAIDPASIIDAAKRVGYDITLDKCECLEDLQFLKCSPVMSIDGSYTFMPNLGPVVRAIGDAKGDYLIPKGSSFEAVVIKQNAQLVHSAFSMYEFGLSTFDTTDNISFDGALYSYKPPAVRRYVDLSSLSRRYRLTTGEIGGLVDVINLFCTSTTTIGYFYRSIVVDRILSKDYGYGYVDSHKADLNFSGHHML